jgi:hypothetical protein
MINICTIKLITTLWYSWERIYRSRQSRVLWPAWAVQREFAFSSQASIYDVGFSPASLPCTYHWKTHPIKPYANNTVLVIPCPAISNGIWQSRINPWDSPSLRALFRLSSTSNHVCCRYLSGGKNGGWAWLGFKSWVYGLWCVVGMGGQKLY